MPKKIRYKTGEQFEGAVLNELGKLLSPQSAVWHAFERFHTNVLNHYRQGHIARESAERVYNLITYGHE